MDMSKAALPPRSGHYTEADRKHPQFATYQSYRSGCAILMIDSTDFVDWVKARELEAIGYGAASHAQYPAFLTWMRQNEGGARRCPAGSFPANFTFWLNGGRW